MSTPTRTDPPHVPLRHGGWPVQKAPRWLLVAGALVLAGAVLTGLAHHPTRSQRAADVNTFLHDMTDDIQSCAGGVRESLTDRKSTRLNSSHLVISYAVFCLKKKKDPVPSYPLRFSMHRFTLSWAHSASHVSMLNDTLCRSVSVYQF